MLFIVASIVFSAGSYAQTAPQSLQDLIATCARRIAIAHQVALSKWDSGSAVEDSSRESDVIQNAVGATQAKELDASWVTSFFRAQIEANKVVQYALLAEWRRAGMAPRHPPVNLKGTIRPELDQIQTTLIADLVETYSLRAQSECPTVVAKAAGDFLAAHHDRRDSPDAIALDRALGTFCSH
jgi:chorismate mutase